MQQWQPLAAQFILDISPLPPCHQRRLFGFYGYGSRL